MTSLRSLGRRFFKAVKLRVMKTRIILLFMRRRVKERRTRAK